MLKFKENTTRGIRMVIKVMRFVLYMYVCNALKI